MDEAILKKLVVRFKPQAKSRPEPSIATCTRTSDDPPLPESIQAWEIERATDDRTGTLRAVKICSFFLEADVWVLYDHSFFPPDGDPVFFDDELVFLAKKSVEELRQIIKVKNVFPRCKVVQ